MPAITTPVQRSVAAVHRVATGAWTIYRDWKDVRGENRRLREEIERLRVESLLVSETSDENRRLRRLLALREALPLTTVAGEVIGRESGGWGREPISLEIGFRILQEVQVIQLGCSVKTTEGQINLFTTPSPELVQVFPAGDFSVRVLLDPNYLREGEYVATLKLFGDGQKQDQVTEAIGIVIQPGASPPENRAYLQKWVRGKLRFDYKWGSLRQANIE